MSKKPTRKTILKYNQLYFEHYDWFWTKLIDTVDSEKNQLTKGKEWQTLTLNYQFDDVWHLTNDVLEGAGVYPSITANQAFDLQTVST